MLLQFTTARIITIYDSMLLQFTPGALLQFTTTIITIHDRYYNSPHYISRQYTSPLGQMPVKSSMLFSLREKESSSSCSIVRCTKSPAHWSCQSTTTGITTLVSWWTGATATRRQWTVSCVSTSSLGSSQNKPRHSALSRASPPDHHIVRQPK